MKCNLAIVLQALILSVSLVFGSSINESISFSGNYAECYDDSYGLKAERPIKNENELEFFPNIRLSDLNKAKLGIESFPWLSKPSTVSFIQRLHKFCLVSLMTLSCTLGLLLIPKSGTDIMFAFIASYLLISVLKLSSDRDAIIEAENIERSSNSSFEIYYELFDHEQKVENDIESGNPVQDTLPDASDCSSPSNISVIRSFVALMTASFGVISINWFHEGTSPSLITYVSLFILFSILNYILDYYN